MGYSHGNCLLVHGLKENDKENTDEITINTFATSKDEHQDRSSSD